MVTCVLQVLRNQFVIHLMECFIWKLEMLLEAYPWVCTNLP